MNSRIRLRLGRRMTVPVAALALAAGVTVPASAAHAGTIGPAAHSSATAVAGPVTVPAIPQTGTVRHVCPAAARGYSECMAEEVVPAAGARAAVRPNDATPVGNAYGPSDLQSAYNLTSASATYGEGRTVAVVDAYDDPNAESDLAVYRSYYHLPACTTANGCFTKVNEYGDQGDYPQTEPSNDDWSGEVSLDLDMVSAICPHCDIMLVEADSTHNGDLAASVDTAVGLGAQFVSNSYGGPQDNTDASAYDHPGTVITASTGDDGFVAGIATPAAFPTVVAVGGTSLLRDPGVSRGWIEITWALGESGCAPDEAKPAWQADTGCSTRSMADVSAVANPFTGVNEYDSYGSNSGWTDIGGTSASSPIIAATYALGGPTLDPYIAAETYAIAQAHPSSINDVVSGTNYPEGGGTCNGQAVYECNAGPGYDGPTGVGTPNGITAFP